MGRAESKGMNYIKDTYYYVKKVIDPRGGAMGYIRRRRRGHSVAEMARMTNKRKWNSFKTI